MHHAFKLGDAEHNLELSRSRGGYRLHLTDRVIPVSLDGEQLTLGGEASPVVIATRGDDVFVHLGGEAYQLHYEHPLERLAHRGHGAADDEVRAPMPGSLVAIAVQAGQSVARGESLLVMESMKMETSIAAPRDGVVQAVHFPVGQPFDRDAVLLTFVSLPRGAGEGEGGGGAQTPPSRPSPVNGGRNKK